MPSSPETLIWGIHPVYEALRSNPGLVREIITQGRPGSGKIQEIIDLARQRKIPVSTPTRLPQPAGGLHANHQGVMARLKGFPTCNLEDLLNGPGEITPTLVALDSIQDPHNLGAIIRSAAAAGAAGIIIPKDRSAPLEGAAAKVAAGAMGRVRICRVTNLADSLKQLKEAGYWIYGADGLHGQNLHDTDLSGKLCLVIGSEGKGLRPLVRQQCDFLVAIPMSGLVESLNASVAAGVMLFEVVRQKNAAGRNLREKA